VYETLKDWVQKAQPDPSTDLSVVTKLACGAAAGTVGQTVAYPLDVVRRRMQVRNAAWLWGAPEVLLSIDWDLKSAGVRKWPCFVGGL
jgi:hypothetical protein